MNYMLSYGAAEPSLLLLKRFKVLEILLPFHVSSFYILFKAQLFEPSISGLSLNYCRQHTFPSRWIINLVYVLQCSWLALLANCSILLSISSTWCASLCLSSNPTLSNVFCFLLIFFFSFIFFLPYVIDDVIPISEIIFPFGSVIYLWPALYEYCVVSDSSLLFLYLKNNCVYIWSVYIYIYICIIVYVSALTV